MLDMTRKLGRLAGTTLLPLVALAACDVVNPGKVLDEDLNNEDALRIVVNGMGGDLTLAHQDFGWNMNVFTGDMSGSSAYKSRVQHWQGQPDEEDAEDYNSLYSAVSVGDKGLERINEVLGSEVTSSPLAAEAYLWAGLANRYAGDAFCQAVIDGGTPQDRSAYHQRAVEYFTWAIDIASTAGTQETLLAAYGARAHSRMQLGDWTGALGDAAMVPDDFSFQIKFDGANDREWNRIFEENARRTNLNTRWTWFDWYDQTYDDPRVVTYTREGVVSADGAGPNLINGKFESHAADIDAVSGTEMRLLEAEHLITQAGQWADGLTLINDVRAAAGMGPWSAGSEAEAFEVLKFERGIDLWLESRRGGDLYRWGNTAAGDPLIATMYEQTPVPSEYPGGAGGLIVPQDQRTICFPFSIRIKSTNENIGG